FINHPLNKVSKKEKLQLQQYIADKQLYEVGVDDLIIRSSELPNFFKPITKSDEVIPSLINLADCLLSSIAEQDRIRQIESNLLVETKKTLYQLKLGFDKIEPLSISFQIGLIKKAMAPVNSAIEGNPLQGLQIMGLLE